MGCVRTLLCILLGAMACNDRPPVILQATDVPAESAARMRDRLLRQTPGTIISLQDGPEEILRVRGHLPLGPLHGASPEEVARALVRTYGPLIGVREGVALVPWRDDAVRGTRVVRLRRVDQGQRVVGGEVVVALDAAGTITYLRHAYPRAPLERTRSPVGKAAARAAASQGLLLPHESRVENRVWVLGDKRHPGWHDAYQVAVHGIPGGPPLSRTVYVRARDGEVVRRQQRLVFAASPCIPCDASVDAACGRVFHRSPVEALDDVSLCDTSDVDAALQDCQLGGLQQGTSRLDGRFATTAPTTPRRQAPFDALRSVDELAVDEVNAYYHVDRAKGFLDGLGLNSVMDYAIGIDAHDDQVGDNAFYDPSVRELHFGQGGVDDAQDPDVVYHEYGHAIQDDLVPGWGTSYVAGSLGEGFGDYFSGAVTDDAFATALGPACLGAWDAVSFWPYDGTPGSGCLRRLDDSRTFPQDLGWEVHADGEIWSAALWSLRGVLGGAVADPMVIQSHTFLSTGPDIVDAADALLAADQARTGGTSAAAIHQAMAAHGIPRTAAPASPDGFGLSVPYTCETRHDYQDTTVLECRFTQPGASKIRFHFSTFETEAGYDFVRISDAAFNEVQVLSGTPFGAAGGYSAAVPGDTIVARFVADQGVTAWGFRIDAVSDAVAGCTSDAECDDGLYCNGPERCSAQGYCMRDALPVLDDGIPCTIDTCDEATRSVHHTPDDGVCSDDRFCDGQETCDPVSGCQPGAPPEVDDGVACTVDACMERRDKVVHAPDDGACDDGLFCNGAEVCDSVQDCQPGVPPALDDGVACTVDACDEETDTVQHTPDASACADDLYCNGAEVCDPVQGCLPGEAVAVDDGDACTLDRCDETLDTVIHEPDPACAPPRVEPKGCGCQGASGGAQGPALFVLFVGLGFAVRLRQRGRVSNSRI